MKKLLLLITICVSSVSFGQVPVIEWHNTYGGSNTESPRCIRQTIDGGYIIAGMSDSNDGDVTGNHSQSDFWVVKLDNVGNISWEKSLGGSGLDIGETIQQTSDGGYIVAGSSSSNDGDVTGNNGAEDFWVVKLDNVGNLSWEKSLGGSGSDKAKSIQQTSDGGYIVAGYSDSNDGDVTGNHGAEDFWVVKLDDVGNLSWEKSLGGSSEDHSSSIQQTSEGGYILAGYSMSNNGDISSNIGAEDFWVVKLDNVGNLSWEKSLGGFLGDAAKSIQQTSDGGYIITGWSHSNDGDVTGNHGESDCWVVKLDVSGNLSWQKPLGSSSWDYGNFIQQTSDGGYIVASNLWDGSNNTDFSIFKLSPDLTSLEELNSNQPKELIKIVNLLGQEVEYTPNTVLIYQYADGTSEKVFTIEK